MKRTDTALFAAVFILAVSGFLTGCSTNLKDAKESTVTVDKKGIVTQALVEDFPSEKYDEKELKSSVEELVKSYNEQAGSEQVTIADIQVKDGTAKVFLTFKTDDDYRGFNRVDFFAGSVKEAQQAGYEFDGAFCDGNGKDVSGETVPGQCGEEQVIIVKEPMAVQIPGNILYVSKNMEILSGKQARLSDDTGIPYENAQAVTDSCGYVIYRAE